MTMTLGQLVLIATRPAGTRRVRLGTTSGRAQVAGAAVVSLIDLSGCVVYVIDEVLRIQSLNIVYQIWTLGVMLSQPSLAVTFSVALLGRSGDRAGWLGRFGKAIAAYRGIVIPIFFIGLMFLDD